MRKCTLLLILMIFLFYLTGCGISNQAPEPSYQFYYCVDQIAYQSPTGVIAPESREYFNTKMQLKEILALYLKGPITEGFHSPYPDGTVIEKITIDDSTINITVSSHFAKLSGIQLTIAGSCLSNTVFSLTSAETVVIHSAPQDSEEMVQLTFTRSNMVFSDNSVMETTEE